MTNKEAYKAIGKRAEELAELPAVQENMLKIASNGGKEAAEKWLYLAAIASLLK